MKVTQEYIFRGHKVTLDGKYKGLKVFISECGGEAIVTDEQDNVVFTVVADSVQNQGILTITYEHK